MNLANFHDFQIYFDDDFLPFEFSRRVKFLTCFGKRTNLLVNENFAHDE